MTKRREGACCGKAHKSFLTMIQIVVLGIKQKVLLHLMPERGQSVRREDFHRRAILDVDLEVFRGSPAGGIDIVPIYRHASASNT